MSEEILPAFQKFANARGRVAVFCFIDQESINRGTVLRLHDELGDAKHAELDLVIHSGGGSAHAAYQLMTLLRLHAEQIFACVPFWAKSAATLLCIGSDKIVLGDHAELGPLDVQIYEEKKKGQGEYHSALDPFKALEQAQAFSVEALASAMRFIVREYEMSYDDSLRHAVSFVDVTTGPLVGRLDPEKLGQYSRELAVASEYGQRLLRRCEGWNQATAADVVDQLVYGYPSHEYVIDYPELKDLGFPVELFTDEERPLIRDIRPLVEGGPLSMIQVVEPEVQEIETPQVEGNGASAAGPAPTVQTQEGTP
jgi:Serine dehydrogenase proteinase